MSHLTHLRTFLDAYRLKSFSKAAEQLGITQPAASMHIQALEALVGKPLFIRRARGVLATDAADDLARSIAPYLDGLEAKLASYRQGGVSGGTVHIVGPSDYIGAQLGNVIAPLMAEGFQLRFQTGNKERIYALLDDGAADLAITASMPDERSHGFAHLLTERLLLVAAPGIARKIGKNPTAERLAKLPLLAFDEDLALVRELWVSMFKIAPTLQATLTLPDLRILQDLVIGGHGWTVLPDYQCDKALADGRLVSPTPRSEAPTNHLYLVWNKSALRNTRISYVRDFILSSVMAGGSAARRPA